MNLLLTTPLRLVPRFMSANDFPMVWGPNPPVTLPLLAAMAGPQWNIKIFDAMVTPLDLKEFGRWVGEADAIGITCSASTLALNAEMTLRLIRRLRPDVPVIMGGHHPTYYAPEWLARGATAVVHGEGEQTFAELLDRIEAEKDLSGVKGISHLSGGKAVREPDRELVRNLDTLPFPRWDLMNMRGYGQFTRRPGLAVSVESSRGCTNSCSFCLASRMWKNEQRYQSIPRVISDLKRLAAMGGTQLGFAGDGFGNPPDYHLQLANAMVAGGIDMDWISFMRVDSILKEPRLPAAMARSGCKGVFIGFESPRQDLLKGWNKGVDGLADVSTYPEVYRMLDREGILVFGFLMAGHPEERVEELPEIFRLHSQWCDVPLTNVIQPMKGTPDYDDYEKRGLLAKDMFYHDVHIPSLKVSQKNGPEIMRIFLKHILTNYPRHIFSAKKPKRQFYRRLYRFMAEEFAAATMEGMRDYIRMLNFTGETPAAIQDAIADKYLAAERLDALAARARKQ
jgi:anaerobic magnesium-protoporphyrin IX monomethyl ester cyclase